MTLNSIDPQRPTAWRLQTLTSIICVLLAGLTACGSPGIPRPPSLDLPEPAKDLRAVRKGDRVFLAWTVPTLTTDGQTIRHAGPTHVCRSKDTTVTDCAKPAGEIAPGPANAQSNPASSGPRQAVSKPKANYVDAVPSALLDNSPASQLFYAVSVLNDKDRSAEISNVIAVPAVRSVLPPTDFQSQVTAQGVVLSWAPLDRTAETPGLKYAYRVYRRTDASSADVVVGELPLDSPLPSEIADHSFEWEKNYSYRCTVVTFIHADGKADTQFEGDDTPEARVFTHDVFPPAVPGGLQAVYSGAGQQAFIDLIWAPDTDEDLAGYNVYRSEGGSRIKVNRELVKTSAYRDDQVASGKTYHYSVTAVDVRGNESAPSGEASESVP
jgi:hypothetical protein